MSNVRWILLRNRINIRNSLNVVGVYFYFSFFFFLIEHFYLPYMGINWFYFEKLLSGMSGSKWTLWTGIWRLFLESKWWYSSFTKPRSFARHPGERRRKTQSLCLMSFIAMTSSHKTDNQWEAMETLKLPMLIWRKMLYAYQITRGR